MNCRLAINQAAAQLHLSTTPRLDAEILLAHVLKITRSELLIDSSREISPTFLEEYQRRILSRSRGVPVAYILGEKEFWGLDFVVTPAVLIPRPETEHLVERALEILKENQKTVLKILELGTGSGCIAIALAVELTKIAREYEIITVDSSLEALQVAKLNYESLISGLPIKFLHSNWFQNVEQQAFDLIVSNPPYVNSNLLGLSPELKYEPATALYAESFGLADIYQIISGAPDYLDSEASLLIEIGSEQRILLENYLRTKHPQAKINFITDLAGKDRIIEIKFS